MENVSPETLRTLPSETLAELKEQAYALDIRFEREVTDERPTGFGRSAIGRLDKSFLEYLQVVDTQGFDQERLIREALKYLEAEE